MIEKLGITPIQRQYNKLLDIDLFSEHEIREVEKQRDERLRKVDKFLLVIILVVVMLPSLLLLVFF